MITIEKTDEGYNIKGLSADDLDIIQEGIVRLFNQSNRKEHRCFRTQVLNINRPIEAVLDSLENKKQLSIDYEQLKINKAQ